MSGSQEDMDAVTLLVEDVRIHSSKKKLSAASKYFDAMFNNSGFVEASKRDVSLSQVSSSDLQVLVQFVDSGNMSLVDVADALQILSTASMLQFETAIEFVVCFISQNLDMYNCLQTAAVADSCGLSKLYNVAKAISLWYFEDIWQRSKEFENLPVIALELYLAEDSLNTHSELSIYHAISRWVGLQKKTGCASNFETLFKCVRLDFLTNSQLKELLKDDLIKQHDLCLEKIQKVVDSRSYNEGTHQKEAMSRQVPKVILAVGGNIDTGSSRCTPTNRNVLMLNDGRLDCITQIPHDAAQLWGHRACVKGKDLYIVGGEIKLGGMRTDWDTSIWCYDSLRDTWNLVAHLQRPRRHHSLVAIGCYLYVIAGIGRHRVILDNVERYNLKEDRWETQPSLLAPAYSVTAASCDDTIFVFSNGIQILQLDAKAWQWLEVEWPSYLNEMTLRTAIPYKTDIYLMGIHSNRLVKYDTVLQEFKEIGNFRNNVGYGCVNDGLIYSLMGEESGIVETYSIRTGLFEVVCEVDSPLEYHDVVVLPKYPAYR